MACVAHQREGGAVAKGKGKVVLQSGSQGLGGLDEVGHWTNGTVVGTGVSASTKVAPKVESNTRGFGEEAREVAQARVNSSPKEVGGVCGENVGED